MVVAQNSIELIKVKRKIKYAVFIINRQNNINILGKTIIDWLKEELVNIPVYVIDCKNENEIKKKLTPYVSSYEYFICLYDNMPYVTNNLINKIIEYMYYKQSNACKLFVGSAYKSAYFLKNDEISYDCFYMQDEDLFYTITSKKDLLTVERYYNKKIIQNLIKSGVIIEKPESLIVSALCKIGKGTIILNNCVLKGKTTIGTNVIINNNTTITDSLIGNNVSISNSIVTKSKIYDNVIISPYCNINKSNIDKDCVVGYYCNIDNYKIKKNTKVSDRSNLIKN